MDLQPNKVDGIVKPITNTRISASEWNQLVGSCMAFITAAGFTPDADDNDQFLNAFIQIAQNMGAIGANVDLSNLSATGENHFVQLQSGVAQTDVDYVVENYQNGTSWYRVYKSGWCEQGGVLGPVAMNTWHWVSFLVSYANTNYDIQAVASNDSNPNYPDGFVGTYTLETGRMQIGARYLSTNGNAYIFWRTCGYKA